jgi:hypothetical protein
MQSKQKQLIAEITRQIISKQRGDNPTAQGD